MNIIIVGAGVVGITLAEYLIRASHNVAIIDNDSTSLNAVQEKMDILAIQGNGVNPSVLKEAGIETADILIAVSPIDEVNIVVCSLGKIFNVKQRFARIRNDELASQASFPHLLELGVTHVIQPEYAVVERILNFVTTPGVRDAANFHDDELLLRGVEITDEMPLAGKSLRIIREMAHSHTFLVVAVIREALGILPMGDFVLQTGDIAYIIFNRESMEMFFTLTQTVIRNVNKIIINGSSLIGEKLCHALESRHIPQIIWLNSNRELAEKAAATLEYTQILDGDGMEVDLLQEVKVAHADFFISVSDETEDNVMSALLARSNGARETVAITNDPRFNDLFTSIGVAHVLSPRIVTAHQIMNIIRGGHFGLVMRLGSTDLDVIHLVVGDNSNVDKQILEDIWKMVRAKFLVGSILRGQDMFIPMGKTKILAGDDIIVITKRKNRSVIQKLFKAR